MKKYRLEEKARVLADLAGMHGAELQAELKRLRIPRTTYNYWKTHLPGKRGRPPAELRNVLTSVVEGVVIDKLLPVIGEILDILAGRKNNG